MGQKRGYMANLENAANNIIPLIVHLIGLLGVIVGLSFLFIGIYQIINKKDRKVNIVLGCISGGTIWLGSILINYIMNYDPFANAKIEYPISLVIIIVVCLCFLILANNNTTHN